MLLDYHKTLSSSPPDKVKSTAPASTPTSVDGITVKEALQVEHSSSSEISIMNPDEGMERLMESLFTALHVEYGTDANTDSES
jgi:hypothetical protein